MIIQQQQLLHILLKHLEKLSLKCSPHLLLLLLRQITARKDWKNQKPFIYSVSQSCEKHHSTRCPLSKIVTDTLDIILTMQWQHCRTYNYLYMCFKKYLFKCQYLSSAKTNNKISNESVFSFTTAVWHHDSPASTLSEFTSLNWFSDRANLIHLQKKTVTRLLFNGCLHSLGVSDSQIIPLKPHKNIFLQIMQCYSITGNKITSHNWLLHIFNL